MSIEDQRRNALSDLRDMLSAGIDPADAVAEAAQSNGLRPDVMSKIGDRLISERDNLISARRLRDARLDRQRRADRVVQLYKDALVANPDADLEAVENSVGIGDLSKDEQGSLFLKTIDAWLHRQING